MDFTERLKSEVADWFPFREGEDFDAWCARVRLEPVGRRALLAATMGAVSKKMDGERAQRKKAWIAAARIVFDPGKRKPCFICGRFRSVAEAHHVVPLGKQFDLGFEVADHEHEWLCPSHHTVLHLWIDHDLPNDRSWQAHGELVDGEANALLDLIKRSSRRR
jgi:hypothetical protein